MLSLFIIHKPDQFIRIAGKWFMNGLGNVEVAKDLDLSAITRKGAERLYANAYPAKG